MGGLLVLSPSSEAADGATTLTWLIATTLTWLIRPRGEAPGMEGKRENFDSWAGAEARQKSAEVFVVPGSAESLGENEIGLVEVGFDEEGEYSSVGGVGLDILLRLRGATLGDHNPDPNPDPFTPAALFGRWLLSLGDACPCPCPCLRSSTARSWSRIAAPSFPIAMALFLSLKLPRTGLRVESERTTMP